MNLSTFHLLPAIPAFVTASALAQQTAPPTQAVRGLATTVEVKSEPTLRAKAQSAATPPIVLRVSRLDAATQRIEFIGAVAGSYDLRDFLEREDGKPLDLAPLSVAIVSKLPANHGVDLFDTQAAWFNWRAHYRQLMWGAVILWAAVPVGYLVWRAARRKPAPLPPPPAAPPPSVEDLLRHALETADPASLSVEQRAQLELLVFRYFAQKLGRPDLLTADPAEIYPAVREHEGARGLVIALERWLHAPHGESAASHASAALLELRRSHLKPASSQPVSMATAAGGAP